MVRVILPVVVIALVLPSSCQEIIAVIRKIM